MCNTFRPQNKQSKAYVERETGMEIDYFIKIEKRNVQNIAKTALFPQKIKQKSQRKASKHESLKLRNRYEKHTTN
jgi:hypothetical protein